MKRFLTSLFLVLCLLLLLLPGCSQAQDTVTIYCISNIQKIHVENDRVYNYYLTYDARGNLLRLDFNGNLAQIQLDENGTILGFSYAEDADLKKRTPQFTRTYDAHGNMLTVTSYTVSGEKETHTVKTYDSNGNVLTHRTYDAHNNLKSELVYTYNRSGNVLTMQRLDSAGRLVKREEYIYDAHGNECLYKSYNSSDHLTDQRESTYDSRGNCIATTSVSNGEPSLCTTQTYDQNNNLLTSRMDSPYSNTFTLFEYTYDTEGRTVSKKYYDGENLQFTNEYLYDENGKCIKQTCYNSKGDYSHHIAWTYDAAGRKIAEEDTHRTEGYRYNWTYGKNNTVLSCEHFSQHETYLSKISYVRITLPRHAAERIEEEQEALLRQLAY